MSAAWITIAALTVATITIKSAGPVAFGGRALPPRLNQVVTGLAPAVLAGLVAFETVGSSAGGVTADARLIGLGAAALALVLRAPLLVVLLAATGATAAARAIGLG